VTQATRNGGALEQEAHAATSEPEERTGGVGEFARNRMRRTQVRPGKGRWREVAEALAGTVEGEVRFADGDRALYATDAGNYRQVPVGVVIPRSIADVVEAVRVAREHHLPILSRGGGTSLAGQSCNAALVIDFSKYLDRILDVDAGARLARVQPGVVLDALRDRVRRHGLTFPPDTSTHAYNSIGGMIGNNSAGLHSVLSQFHGPGARTSDHVEELEVLLYDGTRMRVGATPDEEAERIVRAGGRRGEIYRRLRELRDRYAPLIRERYPRIPRRVSGYNLDDLLPEKGFHVARALAGTEGTCAVVLEAAVRLVERAPVRALAILGFGDVFAAADHVPAALEHDPSALEAVDGTIADNMRRKGLHVEHLELYPEGRGWLLAELGGSDRAEAAARARRLADAARGWGASVRVLDDPEEQERAWLVRESGLGATAFVPGEGDTWEGWEDSAVPPERLGEYLRELRKLYDRYGYGGALYGHFGQGVVHTRIGFDLRTAPGIRDFRDFTREAAELNVRFGGSLSGEHGDGQARGDLLPVMYGEALMEAFREFKRIWDPDWRMNPGKVVDARPRDRDLRLGTEYAPPEVETFFRYPDDRGSFARAALRCVGVGKCRRQVAGTMCPSFQVLREEEHTTRGRAHLLFEMLRGEVVHGGWRSEAVRRSLDLCLSCKGCRGECPVNVDVATYKAEFLAHHYAGRLRPRQAYAFGLVEWWMRLAELAPRVANAAAAAPVLGRLGKLAAGMAPERPVPRFAPVTFRRWWRERGDGRVPGGRRVVLWPDSFNDHFHPEVLRAAVAVLEHAGCEVVVPGGWLPEGRPLYEYGMLRLARWQLRRIVRAMRREVRRGTPVVVLEPSVASVFRDELRGFFPHDEDAMRLRGRTMTLAELLDGELEGWEPPRLEGRALLHGHCHQKALWGVEADARVLARMGLEVEMPDTGCCGMAGSFGLEAGEKHALSVRRGEQVLLPSVRAMGKGDLVVTDGFSCREQVEQGTGRRVLHLAEVVAMGLRAREGAPEPPRAPARRGVRVGAPVLLAGAAVLALGAAWVAAGGRVSR
jgi:FAD/FMN-containing dehydrogenase/Fe-S oxidoreductase